MILAMPGCSTNTGAVLRAAVRLIHAGSRRVRSPPVAESIYPMDIATRLPYAEQTPALLKDVWSWRDLHPVSRKPRSASRSSMNLAARVVRQVPEFMAK